MRLTLTPQPSLTPTLTVTPPLLLLPLPLPHGFSSSLPIVDAPFVLGFVSLVKKKHPETQKITEYRLGGSEWVASAPTLERVALAGGVENRARRF